MKKISLIVIVFFLINYFSVAQEVSLSAQEILARVDTNDTYSSISYEGEMIIEYQGRKYIKIFTAYGRGTSDSFIHFTNNEDRGTKYLRTAGRLYVYSPNTEQVMLISGHMLKESMMGSDLSYEDTIENEKLSVRYTASLEGSEVLDGNDVWVLALVANKKTESYPKQKLWVDKKNFSIVKNDFYALSGAKLKEYTLIKSEYIDGRYFPVEIKMRDLLRKNSSTVFKMTNVSLNVPLDDSMFSLRQLER